jgi:NADPH:quinone reductase-like Zn-dependent oxidoreductase
MLAAWYERQGPASAVLQVGELRDPEPGAGEVRVRIRFSGVNPGKSATPPSPLRTAYADCAPAV